MPVEIRNYSAKKGDEDEPLSLVKKGWGYESHLLNNENLCVKVMNIGYRKECSLHFHIKKEELFFIMEGIMLFDFIDTKTAEIMTSKLSAGDSVYIPKGVPHRFTGASLDGCLFLECSTHDDPEDSYRVQKGDSQK